MIVARRAAVSPRGYKVEISMENNRNGFDDEECKEDLWNAIRYLYETRWLGMFILKELEKKDKIAFHDLKRKTTTPEKEMRNALEGMMHRGLIIQEEVGIFSLSMYGAALLLALRQKGKEVAVMAKDGTLADKLRRMLDP
jgi:hypothetical protein